MDYELARQLKEAGFPIKKANGAEEADFIAKNYGIVSMAVIDSVLYKLPTLTELIEACGEGFFAISHWPEGWTAEGGPIIGDGNKNWTAQIQCKNLPSAEEAVAKLWIALNKKDA
jgi:hypothetical protein